MINAISREGRKPGSCKAPTKGRILGFGFCVSSNVQAEAMTTREDQMDEANKPSPVPSAAERKRIFWEKVQAKKKVKG